MSAASARLRSLSGNIISRLILYYAAVYTTAWGIWRFLPADTRSRVSSVLGPVLGEVSPAGELLAPFTAAPPVQTVGAQHTEALVAVFVCFVAVVLSLPIAWVYMYTRQKKGYQQSVVHSIVLLPAVVAAISVLVRNNIALAFSRAGIVAAVRFRTSLEDTRDAVFVFGVCALGLASGVNVEFAAVLSVLFAAIALLLWYTDFGRTPPALEGERAEQHMQRALEIANRTSQFVARVDREILEDLAPAQLDALANRVKKRRATVSNDDGPRYNATLTVRVTDDQEGRAVLERTLRERTKRYELIRSETGDGDAVLVYGVRTRKGLRLDELQDLLQRESVPYLASIDLEEN